MRALVTGGAGFIGSHLTEHLLAGGHEVVVLDDLSTGRLSSLDLAGESPSFRFVEGSVLDGTLVDALVERVDTVFHLAAAVGSFVIRDHTLESLRTNLHGTENVIEAASRYDARILVTSTSEIYGKNTKRGLSEDDDRVAGSPLKSRWSYAEAKALDETLAFTFWAERGLRSVIVRPFNTVGPGQTGRYGMVIPRFVSQALAGEPLTVHGTGRQTRCFCHVAELVPALVALVRHPSAYGQVFNLGNSEQIAIEDLARRVIAATGSRSGIVHRSYQEAYGPGYEDMESRVPDCTRARELVGFTPRLTLDDILRDVIEDQTSVPGHSPAVRA